MNANLPALMIDRYSLCETSDLAMKTSFNRRLALASILTAAQIKQR